ncbi:phage tail assembly chaperone [Glaesserella parasuis]
MTYTEIEAWNRLFQRDLAVWEIKVIKQLDVIFLNVQNAEI